ncbi:hypothetical protein [Halolamina salifodinae]|uniref:Uncharacterized protein n=1 Tax=Halolamina salifodinae TaxID=1202767 RepID=A0A8T4GSC3_9EURY|nr:hypothetical protein [Halolamina salifodinae]MBP1986021.1 hypothetical protein [Halolamina salifodinae]
MISIAALLSASVFQILFPESQYANYPTVAVIAGSFLLAVYVYAYVDGIDITYIQVEPELERPARNHQIKQFRTEEGYIEFDAFVEVPPWMDEFDLRFQTASPFTIGLWRVPDDFDGDDNRITCYGGAHDFGFKMTVGGDISDLGMGSRDLCIIENRRGETVDKLQLLTEETEEDGSHDYRSHHSS